MKYLTPNVEIPTSGGLINGYLARPKGDIRATVAIQNELWGMTEHMREVAERLANAGYAALVIDLFRGATPPLPSDPHGKWAAAFESFDDVRATLDCRAAFSWLATQQGGFQPGPIFAWGFCMGGRFAHNLAALESCLAGTINFYGRINFPKVGNKPFLPVELTQLIECPYLGAFAPVDPLIPMEDVDRLRNDLVNSPNVQIDVYEGADHAFFNDHRDTYHEKSAQLAWTRVLAFLDRHAG